MGKNFINNLLNFDTGDDPDGAPAISTDFYIYIKHPFQTLRPGHGYPSFIGCFIFFLLAFTSLCWRDGYPVFAVGCEYAVEPGQVYSRLGHQCGQFSNEI